MANVAVLIVGYRNPDDIADCLRALAMQAGAPRFAVFIVENGGAPGMDALIARLEAGDPAWSADGAAAPPALPADALRRRDWRLIAPDGALGGPVHVAEAPDNLGYAGGVNFWLKPLLATPGWDAVWLLNPDTTPAPDALAELVAFSSAHAKGMVGSCIVHAERADAVFTRGLEWRALEARVRAIGRGAPLADAPDPAAIEARLSAPSGASVYVTRKLIETIGLMDERYFLYVEDLEWGERAARLGEVGYAHRSRVPHKCGATIGGTTGRAARSPLSVYLTVRNTVLYVRERRPAWLAWTVLMQCAELARYGAAGAFGNMRIGLAGLAAGLRGEVGRPDHLMKAHRP